MGHSTLLDVIGSMTTFGLLLLIALRLNASASENSNAYNANYILQTNMCVLTVMLEDDLRNVGLGYIPTVANPSPIILAQSDRFSFWMGGNRIDYIVGPPSELNAPQPGATPNLNDRYLYRNVNGVQNRMNLGVTQMNFRYWDVATPTDSLTTPVASVGNIGPVDVSIRLESPYKMKQDYMNDSSQYEMFWRQIRSVARSTVVQLP